MDSVMLQRMRDAVTTPEELAATVDYLVQQMNAFLRPVDKVLICFPDDGPCSLGGLFTAAVRKMKATPILLGEDHRWKTILKLAFHSRATAIVAPPLVVLGLTKLAKMTKTPLYFRNVITAGYFCYRWMVDGIKRGLDCDVWGCYDACQDSMVAGFTCKVCSGIHIRQDKFCFDIQDEGDQVGDVFISLKSDPTVRLNTFDRARFSKTTCACGSTVPLLVDFGPGSDVDEIILEMGAQFHTWTSILDAYLFRGECGLELELVTFPGEKLPKFPTVAKLIVRPWDPERDVPNWFQAGWRNSAQNG